MNFLGQLNIFQVASYHGMPLGSLCVGFVKEQYLFIFFFEKLRFPEIWFYFPNKSTKSLF